MNPKSNSDPGKLSDADLARALLAPGAERSRLERELVRRFAPRVRLYGLRHLRSEDAAEELSQRVLLLTLQKLRAGEVRAPEQIASFVLGSARLTARALQREQPRHEPLDAAEADAVPSLMPEPLEISRQALVAGLSALSERERTVLLLTYFADQDAAEIGRRLSITLQNVRVLRHRALEKLRARLGEATAVTI